MYIRQIKKTFAGSDTEYIQHRLVESVRTPKGPRQKTLLNLGTLTIPEEKFKDLANAIEALMHGQPGLFGDDDPQLAVLARHYCDLLIAKRLSKADEKIDEPIPAAAAKADSTPEPEVPQYETVDVNSTTTSNARTVGAEQIVLAQMNQLSFFDILNNLGFDETAQKRSAAQVIARLAHPSSERETARFLRETSAAGELLDADFSKISDNILHRTTDLLLKNKTAIEDALAAKSRDLFTLSETLILYDLTNTFFESGKKNSDIARYGRSKEKRSDCPLVSLALVIDGKGFPKRSRIYKGNVSEPGTLAEMLDELPKYDGDDGRQRTVVIDAGIATETNLALIRERNLHYVAVSRKRGYAKGLFDEGEWNAVGMSKERTLNVKSAKVDDEVWLLCQSEARAAKDEEIEKGRCEKFEKGLEKSKASLSNSRKTKYDDIIERIGRLKERHQVGHLYSIKVTQQDGFALDISFTKKASKVNEFGEYVIRTDRIDLADREISALHRTLTMVEGSFRWMKQDLGLRPNFHQVDNRMEGHIFVTVLAYFILAPILMSLGWGGRFINYGPKDDKAAGTAGDDAKDKKADGAADDDNVDGTREKKAEGTVGDDTGDGAKDKKADGDAGDDIVDGTKDKKAEGTVGDDTKNKKAAGDDDNVCKEVPSGWKSVVNTMATMVRVTTSFTCKDGRRMHVRTTCEPNRSQLLILRKLGLKNHMLKRTIYKEE